jgi:hypothetical protein
MNAVRFHVVVGADRVLALPEGVELLPGPAEVIVLQAQESNNQTQDAAGETLSQRLARKAHELNLHGLPADLAENHDHYLHGLAKGIDEQ